MKNPFKGCLDNCTRVHYTRKPKERNGNRMATYLVIVHSRGDSRLDVHEHDYEIEAYTAEQAVAEARQQWEEGIQPMWPDLSIEDAFVIDEEADPNTWEFEFEGIFARRAG